MRTWMSLLLFVTVTLLLPLTGVSQQPAPVGIQTVFTSQAAEVAGWDARVLSMEASQELRQVAVHADALAPAWTHQRLQQFYRGLPIFGAQMIRHWRNGRVAAVNGKFYPTIDLDTTPGIGTEEAGLAAERASGSEGRAVSDAELLVYPHGGTFVLAYRLHVRTREDLLLFFIDAKTGAVVDQWSDRRTQVASVGRGTGTWEDIKKMATTQQNGEYVARDGLRPAVAWTVDAKGRFEEWYYYDLDPAHSAASDPDNDWVDGAVVDAHVYAGWTYDYYYKRFGRRGINDANRAVTSYVHFWPRSRQVFPPFSYNAFWDPRDKSVNYGDGDGELFNFFSSALDVVVHELTHGVLQFTSDLIYQDESGALSEAFCDIMATGAEFFFEPIGRGRQRADWAAGEDLFIDSFEDGYYAIRYYVNPLALDDPDHYRIRYTGQEDNGGVHTNSLIGSHAFYLFVEGGTNRTSGMYVDGIGFQNLEQAEKIFYRAFTSYLVPSSDFSDARQATLRSARDLYGADGIQERQLARAWSAVGVQ